MTRALTVVISANNRLIRQTAVLLAGICLCTMLSGCVSARMMMVSRRDPMAGARRLSNAKNPKLEEVVAHVNQNTELVQSWRANNVRIQANNMPLSGTLAVEKGRHVRLVVNSPLGSEVDLGSNDERFWVWSRRMEPAYVTCKHENMDVARQSLGVPFEPDWLMEALGVSPLPATGVTMEADPTNQQVRLIQQVMTAHGRPLRRVVLVDLKKGNGIVVEHSLYDYFGKRVALARLSGHRLDKESGAVLPHRVMLDWPQSQMQIVMDLGKIQVNPKSIPSQVWAMPELPGYEVVDLDGDTTSTRLASGVRLGSIETSSRIQRGNDDQSPSDDAVQSGHARLSDESEGDATTSDDEW